MNVKPCPFCGERDLIFLSYDCEDNPYVVCDECDAMGSTKKTEEEAVRIWNSVPRYMAMQGYQQMTRTIHLKIKNNELKTIISISPNREV